MLIFQGVPRAVFVEMFGDEVLNKASQYIWNPTWEEFYDVWYNTVRDIELYTEDTITAHISRVNEPQFGHGCW